MSSIAGRPKESGDYDTFDYFIAQQIAHPNNYIPESELGIAHPDISPEAKVIKADLYHKLSDEAKDVIDVVTNRPIQFLKFAWNNDPWYSSLTYYVKDRRLKKTPSNELPYRIPKRNGYRLESRMTNLHVIKLFFRRKWKKGPRFVDKVIDEICSFVEVL